MALHFSPVAMAQRSSHGSSFSAYRLDLRTLEGFTGPIMGFDHFLMAGPTFAPHPHAGFSAVSYLFADSPGGLRNRDSLGNDLVIEAGEAVWTQASSGIVHDEFPARNGLAAHGLQLFVNLSRASKDLPPKMLHATHADIPELEIDGASIRVIAGNYLNIKGAIQPAEPFLFLDLSLEGASHLQLPANRSVLFYVVSGSASLRIDGKEKRLQEHEAIAVRVSESLAASLYSAHASNVLVLSGIDLQEPVATYGPFIMNDEKGLQEAYARYTSGQMGRLTPLDA